MKLNITKNTQWKVLWSPSSIIDLIVKHAEHAKCLDNINMQYDLIAHEILSSPQKIFIGSKDNRKCRFCGKDSSQTTFKKIAHAFPEFLGNKTLIAYDECDECNEYFSETVEDSFGKYLAPFRTVLMINGKNGAPTYKSNDERVRIGKNKKAVQEISAKNSITPPDNKSLLCKLPIDDYSIVTVPKNNEVHFSLKRQKYIKQNVLKCLHKMALSALPESELEYFKDTISWIRGKNSSFDEHVNFQAHPCIYTFVPGPRPYQHIEYRIYKSKELSSPISPYLFVMFFENIGFQIGIAFSDFDKGKKGKYSMPYYPSKHHSYSPFGQIKFAPIDLTSNEVTADEFERIVCHYDDRIPLDLDATRKALDEYKS